MLAIPGEKGAPAPHESEYDVNGHYKLGPRLSRPSLWRMIAEAQGTLVRPEAPALTGRERKRRARIALSMHERRKKLAAAIVGAR